MPWTLWTKCTVLHRFYLNDAKMKNAYLCPKINLDEWNLEIIMATIRVSTALNTRVWILVLILIDIYGCII